MEQMTGLAWITGHVDDQPRIQRGPCDPLAGMHAAFATLVALRRARAPGPGPLRRVHDGRGGAERGRRAGRRVQRPMAGLMQRMGNRAPLRSAAGPVRLPRHGAVARALGRERCAVAGPAPCARDARVGRGSRARDARRPPGRPRPARPRLSALGGDARARRRGGGPDRRGCAGRSRSSIRARLAPTRSTSRAASSRASSTRWSGPSSRSPTVPVPLRQPRSAGCAAPRPRWASTTARSWARWLGLARPELGALEAEGVIGTHPSGHPGPRARCTPAQIPRARAAAGPVRRKGFVQWPGGGATTT